MANTIIRRIVEIFVILLALGGLIQILRSGLAAMSGEFDALTWPVSTDTPQVDELASKGDLEWTDGMLRIDGQPAAQLFDIGTSLVAVGLLIVALLALRRFLIILTEGEVFTGQAITNLRRIGFALLAICVLSLIDAVVLQWLILSVVELPGGMVLQPSISWNSDDVTNVWLEYDVPVDFFVLGCLALFMAEAFKAGRAFREDSESVV